MTVRNVCSTSPVTGRCAHTTSEFACVSDPSAKTHPLPRLTFIFRQHLRVRFNLSSCSSSESCSTKSGLSVHGALPVSTLRTLSVNRLAPTFSKIRSAIMSSMKTSKHAHRPGAVEPPVVVRNDRCATTRHGQIRRDTVWCQCEAGDVTTQLTCDVDLSAS